MGCVAAKPLMNSPPQGLQRLKVNNGYTKGGYNQMESRKSTGQRHRRSDFRPEDPPTNGVRSGGSRKGSGGSSGRDDKESEKLVHREREGYGSGRINGQEWKLSDREREGNDSGRINNQELVERERENHGNGRSNGLDGPLVTRERESRGSGRMNNQEGKPIARDRENFGSGRVASKEGKLIAREKDSHGSGGTNGLEMNLTSNDEEIYKNGRINGQKGNLIAKEKESRGSGRIISKEGKLSGGSSSSGGGRGGSDGGNVSRRFNILSKPSESEELVDGWPKWLVNNIPKDALAGLVPKSAEAFEKLDKVGQGTYSNVYKARERETGKIVALKKVRFDTSEPESVKFMAREIMILRKLDHPNIVKLQGLATSRMQYSLYLVFDYMQTDLSRVISRPDETLSEPQIKCYMQQLLSGLEHCHEKGILHRDIKGSNLLIDRNGMLKIADFGLANFYSPERRRKLTSRVVTLWYRAPELLLGSTDYGPGIDLWSVGCLMAEMFAGRPIMPGRTEVEQLHRIFRLCGTPSEDYWKKLKVLSTFRPPSYKRNLRETFRDFPKSSLGLLNILLALEPENRGSTRSALCDEFFHSSPLACDLSGLPVVRVEEDDAVEANERRKSRLRRRSRTHKERSKRAEMNINPQGNSLTKEMGTDGETVLRVQELEISTKTSRSTITSIAVGEEEEEENGLLFPTPAAPRRQSGTYMSEAHPGTTKNVKNLPPLPNGKPIFSGNSVDADGDGGVYRVDKVPRSASTREFRKNG